MKEDRPMEASQANIPNHANETYALERHWQELVEYPSPVHFINYHLIETMEKLGKPVFKIPKELSKLDDDLTFVFKKVENCYLYRRVLCRGEVIKEYDKTCNYLKVS